MSGIKVNSLGLQDLMEQEWLATNQIGGYASQSVLGLNTRKYHGLLVAAMSPPVRRMVILSRMEDFVRAGGRTDPLFSCEYPGVIHPNGKAYLKAFSATPYPRWAYQNDGWTIEKNLRLLRGENTVVLSYTLLTGDKPVELDARPLLALRPIHDLMYQWNGRLETQIRSAQSLRINPTPRTPEAYISHDGVFEPQPNWYLATIYRRETERGYSGLEDVWTPGIVRWQLTPGQTVHIVCSTDPIDLEHAIATAGAIHDFGTNSDCEITNGHRSYEPIRLNDSTLQTLLSAGEQFVAESSDHSATVICGFPWQSVSGRDALISFTGLLLVPRKFAQARSLLRSLLSKVLSGLIPSELPEDGSEPVYYSADASLWLANAIYAYLKYTNDESTVQKEFFEPLVRIIRRYWMGTSLGIECSPDGLISSRQSGLGTSWMNAKIADWLITPRAGQPVELNALWYNALRILADLADRFGRQDWRDEFTKLAAITQTTFNNRFWNAAGNCCFDVIADGGADASLRPNQLIAISLPFPILWPDRWAPVVQKVRDKLLTPVGLRTLSRDEPGYQPRYQGDVVSRDRAYHQGSVYPWLLGPYVSALVRADNRSSESRNQGREALAGCLHYMEEAGLGQICELFDGDSPHRPGGTPASARSVAEILRCYVEDVIDPTPPRMPNSEKTPQLTP